MRHEGWMHAIDTQMDTLKWHRTGIGERYNIALLESMLQRMSTDGIAAAASPNALHNAHLLNEHWKETLHRGDTIFITSDMMHIIMQAAEDLPQDVTYDPHTLLTPRGFCIFEEGIEGVDRAGKSIVCNAVAWGVERAIDSWKGGTDAKDIVCLYFLVDPHDERDWFNKDLVPEWIARGETVPPLWVSHFYPLFEGEGVPDTDEMGSDIVKGVIKLFLAMQLIAQQKIGTPMEINPDRPTRKRMKREDFPDRIITLITLRRKSVKKDDEPQKVEWSRRWIVRGFWRRQWFPKAKRHDWVYIHEYIKGPEDKPLVITERRVFNFRR